MDLATLAAITPFFVAVIWAVVQTAKTRVPRLATNTEWCPIVAIALGEAIAFGVAAESQGHVGWMITAEYGLLLGGLAVGSHETGQRLPGVFQDFLSYLNQRNFGTTAPDLGQVEAGMSGSAQAPSGSAPATPAAPADSAPAPNVTNVTPLVFGSTGQPQG